MDVLKIGSRRELFTDRWLVDELAGVEFRLQTPQPVPAPACPVAGHYMTVFKDGPLFRAYYRNNDPGWQGGQEDGNCGEYTAYAESRDGQEWSYPDLGLFNVAGSMHNNAVLRMNPYCHNFAPFRDANPAASPSARYKALAGTIDTDGKSGGLHVFHSPDGLHWTLQPGDHVIGFYDYAFDSQNVSFWSEAEAAYVCYFRTCVCTQGRLRAIHRTTSPDFIHWTEPVALNANLPGEHLYTSQTHPYFRAPHLYVALPTRFQPERGDSTDILFMTTRAGSTKYDRLFTEAFIRPGLDPARWGNRSNYAACGVVPTGPAEMSIYHGPGGFRYTLRTDGFISLHGGFGGGTMTTKVFTFSGNRLSLNAATSAGGGIRAELQDAQGRPLPGRSLADCNEFVGDSIDQVISWKGSADVSAFSGRPVRLHVALKEADLYSLQFV